MMRAGILDGPRAPRRVLILGAHADDIEIGCGGTILELVARRPDVEVAWAVLCGSEVRAAEARASAAAFLGPAAARARVEVMGFRDGFLPYQAAVEAKERFETLKRELSPDLILTHAREDRHQDHRFVSDLTWNTWRDHLILEYEIPKYDGDFGAPNVFSVLSAEVLERKVALILEHFRSQAGRHWFSADLFRSVARLRGMECAEAFAEGFTCRKLVL